MDDTELRQHESEVLNRLQASEVHWHIIKALLVGICALITIAVVISYSNQTKAEIRKNRRLVSCALTAFSPSNDGRTSALINKCIRDNQ